MRSLNAGLEHFRFGIVFGIYNKKLYRAFRRQVNTLTLNTPVFQGLLRVNRKAKKDA